MMNKTLLLNKQEVNNLLDYDECIAAVENAFKQYAVGNASPPGILGIHAKDGGFHIKAGILNLNKPYFVMKINSNFSSNESRFGLPLIQGLVAVFDCDDGQLLAVMDSIAITILRTGAATAVAAKYLSLPDASVVTICGCGNQGRISLRMLSRVRSIKVVYAVDVDKEKAQAFADEMSAELKIRVIASQDIDHSVQQSQICITCTPSKKPFLKRNSVMPGTFIAAVGADSEDKQELEVDLVASSKIVVDLIEQAAKIGELHHAIENGVVTRQSVHAELGEIIAGTKQGRTSKDEIILFDSTGMALQDVAAASIVYEKAVKNEIGLKFNFA
jgi:alanine dehydrogenase